MPHLKSDKINVTYEIIYTFKVIVFNIFPGPVKCTLLSEFGHYITFLKINLVIYSKNVK